MPRIGDQKILSGALLLSFAFGSIHAFGVLLGPLQVAFGANRAGVSMGYSIAIASLTGGVFLSRLARLALTPSWLSIACGLGASAGLVFAASGVGFPAFLLGYGVIFGFANGIAYSLSLDLAARSAPGAGGWAMGLATSAYGLGAAVFSQVLAWLAVHYSVLAALWFLAVAVGAAGLFTASLLAAAFTSADRVASAGQVAGHEASLSDQWTIMLWVIYFLGASGGLMVIAHAVGIMTERGASPELSSIAPTLIAFGSISGSSFGGAWAGRATARLSLATPLAILSIAMAGLLLTSSSVAGFAMLLVCGGCYGGLIAAIPVIIRRATGEANFPKIFGFVFTSWGVAGICGPSIAGLVYDHYGQYEPAILLAGIAACAAVLLSLLLPK